MKCPYMLGGAEGSGGYKYPHVYSDGLPKSAISPKSYLQAGPKVVAAVRIARVVWEVKLMNLS